MSAAGATRRAVALFAAVSKTAIVKPTSASPARIAGSSGRRSLSSGSITSLFGVFAAFRRSPQLTSDACGSRSSATTRSPAPAAATASEAANVVLPTPPFCDRKAMLRIEAPVEPFLTGVE